MGNFLTPLPQILVLIKYFILYYLIIFHKHGASIPQKLVAESYILEMVGVTVDAGVGVAKEEMVVGLSHT